MQMSGASNTRDVLTININSQHAQHNEVGNTWGWLGSVIFLYLFTPLLGLGLQCFDAVGWVAGRASGL